MGVLRRAPNTCEIVRLTSASSSHRSQAISCENWRPLREEFLFIERRIIISAGLLPLQLTTLKSTKLHSQSHHDNLLFSVPTFDGAGLWITCPPRCNGLSPWHGSVTTEHLQVIKTNVDMNVDWQLHIPLPCITSSSQHIETSVITKKQLNFKFWIAVRRSERN